MKIKYSFKQWCLDNNHQDWLDLWDYELNEIKPEEISFKSHKSIWFKCPLSKHQSEFKTAHSIVTNNHLICLQCDSFGQWLLDEFGENAIGIYWSNKNDISPFSVSKASSQEVWMKCVINNHPDYKTRPVRFRNGQRCGVCRNRQVIFGINSVYDTNPELVKFFVDIEDSKKCTVSSKDKQRCKCPYCGHEKDIFLYNLVRQGFCCPNCSDGVSYPNKFMANVLRNLQRNCQDIIFDTEKTFEWSKCVVHNNHKLCGSKRYDFYIKLDKPIIIECHGAQHYREAFFNGTRRRKTVIEEQENDDIKRKLAITNGIAEDRYVVIDCSIANMKFIKNSIMTSELPRLLSFTECDVDWEECERLASSSLLNQCCDLWNSGIKNATAIANIIGVSCTTAIRYLAKGSDIGLCNYQSHKNKKFTSL